MSEIDMAKMRETFYRGEFSFAEENKNIGLLCDEIDRLRALLRRAGEALAPACSGGDWGRVLAWIVNGASSDDAGIAAAKKLVAMQKGADTVAREIEEALDAS